LELHLHIVHLTFEAPDLPALSLDNYAELTEHFANEGYSSLLLG
jgi:hypothetical protein